MTISMQEFGLVVDRLNKEIERLRAAIAAAERQKPAASIKIWEHRGWKYAAPGDYAHLPEGTHILYAHPPAITDKMVERAALALNKRFCNAVGVDEPGQWIAHKTDLEADARAALEAAWSEAC